MAKKTPSPNLFGEGVGKGKICFNRGQRDPPLAPQKGKGYFGPLTPPVV
jgi:hypothetical protein